MEEVFVPERVFLKNLSNYLYIDDKLFLEDINNRIEADIHSLIHRAKDILKNIKQKNNISVIPSEFKDFVENNNERKHYYMLQCYYKIKSLLDYVTTGEFEKVGEDDLNLINKFEILIEEFACRKAISLKQLKRLLDVNGKEYKESQTRIINYILTRVVPYLFDEEKKNFFCNSNDQIVLIYSGCRLKPVYECRKNIDFRKVLVQINKLKLEIYSSMDEEIIGNNLWNIFKLLQEQHKNNKLVFSMQELKSLTEIDDDNLSEEYNFYASHLSSQIIGYIRYLTIITDKCDKDMLDVIDNVIYNNLNTFLDDYGIIISRESLKYTSSLNNIFIDKPTDDLVYSSKLDDLRRFLLSCLLDFEYFKELFVDLYLTNHFGGKYK